MDVVVASSAWLKPLQRVPLSIWRALAMVLAIAWFCWGVVALAWLIYDAVTWRAPVAVADSTPVLVKRSVDITALIDAHIFGAADVVKDDAPQEIAETTVALKLVGVYGASDESKASAIVEQPGGQQDVVFVGGTMPGNNGTLKQVFGDRIVFDRGGRLETLRMEDATAQLAHQLQTSSDNLVATSATVDHRKDAQLAARLAELRQQFQNDPASIADLITIEPVSTGDGGLRGYRVTPGKDRKLFARAGLQRNDLLRAVNGVSLDDPKQALGLMNELQNANEISLTIDRGGQIMTVQLPLSQR